MNWKKLKETGKKFKLISKKEIGKELEETG